MSRPANPSDVEYVPEASLPRPGDISSVDYSIAVMSPGRGREASGIYSTSEGVMKDALAPSVSSSR